MKENNEESIDAFSAGESTVSRRKFFGKLGGAAVGAAALSAAAPFVDKKGGTAAAADGSGSSFYHQRAQAAYQFRVSCAQDNFQPIPPRFKRPNNADETRYLNRIGSYSKGLPHQSNGEVVPQAYNAMLDALRTGNPALFEQIPLGGVLSGNAVVSGFVKVHEFRQQRSICSTDRARQVRKHHPGLAIPVDPDDLLPDAPLSTRTRRLYTG